jgi:hypothetical protein
MLGNSTLIVWIKARCVPAECVAQTRQSRSTPASLEKIAPENPTYSTAVFQQMDPLVFLSIKESGLALKGRAPYQGLAFAAKAALDPPSFFLDLESISDKTIFWTVRSVLVRGRRGWYPLGVPPRVSFLCCEGAREWPTLLLVPTRDLSQMYYA